MTKKNIKNKVIGNIKKGEQLEIFYSEFLQSTKSNLKITDSTYKIPFKWIETVFDCQQSIFKWHYWTIEFARKNSDKQVISTAAYVKNMHSFIAATELTKLGLYGSARIILRQIFEFLIIGKYVSETNDERYAKHWLNSGQVNISKQILHKIKSPKVERLETFYSMLCDFTHATTSAQQIGIKIRKNDLGIYETLMLIFTLLECNYYLLNKHFIDSEMEYYANISFREAVKDKKRHLLKHFVEIKKHFYKKPTNQLIYSYRRKWTF